MNNTMEQESGRNWLPAGVLAAACLFLGLLLSAVRPAVFFSGDGGLKYLVTQQINRGGDAIALQPEAAGWVQSIWEKGFSPFKPPFVYEQQGKKIVSFPPFYQQLSAPFLQVFGFAGLYCLPAASLLLLWLWFGRLLYQLKIQPAWIAAALFCLSFCSPITLYGAVYWEHTLAWLLLFGGVVFLLQPCYTSSQAFVCGCLTGLSVWLRPEALLFWLLLLLPLLYNQVREPRKSNIYFFAGSAACVALFFVCNKILYGDFLGAHAYQLDTGTAPGEQFAQSLVRLTHLNGKLLLYFPLALVIYAAVIYLLVKKKLVPTEVVQLLFVAGCFSLIAPFFLPNGGGKQWGPRYFLLLIPPLLVAGTMLANALPVKRSFLIGIIVPIVLYSFYLNSFSAYKTLHDDYAYRVQPCLKRLQQDSCQVVIVQNQFIAQEFAALFATKQLFLAENRTQYLSLQTLLLAAGKHQWLLVARDKPLLLAVKGPTDPASIVQAGDYFFVKCSAENTVGHLNHNKPLIFQSVTASQNPVISPHDP